MENNLPTSDLRGHRTLATVVFTDCVAFSAKMSVNEGHTLDLIRRDLKLMRQICERFEGRVLKSTGDGLLMYFSSGVKAVECSVEIQKTLIQAALTQAPEDSLQHRIGIHLSDMFITDTDVMGNGVNIAARLQAEADPGGICISQTVYDVVRSGLHLETKYLGPRELKNIREVVPVYKVLLEPEPDDPCAIVSQILEQNKHLNRIKKLLLYVCRNYWESDPNRLDALNLSQLLTELLGMAPTQERLEPLFTAAVKTLSKPAEYSLIASIVLSESDRLYAQSASPAAARPSPQSAAPSLYDRLAYELEQSANPARLKKLVFYICRNRWEHDPDRLQDVALPDLIAELHRIAPTVGQLRLIVDGYVRTLSKQAEYAIVADKLLDRLHGLYQPPSTATQSSQPASAIAETASGSETPSPEHGSPELAPPGYESVVKQLEHEQNWLRIKKLMLYLCRKQWESNTAVLNSIDTIGLVQELHRRTPAIADLEATLSAVVKTLNKPAEYAAIARSIVHHLGPLYPNYLHPNDSPPPPAPLELLSAADGTAIAPAPEPALPTTQSELALKLFDARLGIMKYANPLRAKIVVFSALHEPFRFSPQDWRSLKLHELDGLLRQLLILCKTYTDLEANLYRVARQLHDSDTHIETATAVIRCLRTFYVHGSPTALLAAVAEDTAIGLDDFEEATEELRGREDSDHTHQLQPTTALTQVSPESMHILSALPHLAAIDDRDKVERTLLELPPSDRGE